MRLIRTALLAVLMSSAVLLAPAAPAAAAPEHLQISMSNFAFAPSALTIHSGDAVTWTNHDSAPHDVTVTSGPASIHSPMLSTGQSWTYTFTAVGTYSYVCSIHPDMRATLTVLATPVTTHAAAAPHAASSAVVAAPVTPAGTTAAPATTAHSSGSTPTPTHASTPTTATSSTAAAAAAAPASGSSDHAVKPLLLVAGLVAAIATFCLLLLASRPDDAPAA